MRKQEAEVRYVTDDQGKNLAVIVPIELWREIQSERETAYLLSNPVMKKRLLKAIKRKDGFSLEEVRAKLGI